MEFTDQEVRAIVLRIADIPIDNWLLKDRRSYNIDSATYVASVGDIEVSLTHIIWEPSGHESYTDERVSIALDRNYTYASHAGDFIVVKLLPLAKKLKIKFGVLAVQEQQKQGDIETERQKKNLLEKLLRRET